MPARPGGWIFFDGSSYWLQVTRRHDRCSARSHQNGFGHLPVVDFTGAFRGPDARRGPPGRVPGRSPSGRDSVSVVAVPHLPVSIVMLVESEIGSPFTADHRRTSVFMSGDPMRELAALTEAAR